MKRKELTKRFLSMILVLCMLISAAPVVSATDRETGKREQGLSFEKVDGVEVNIEPQLPELKKADDENTYADTDHIRVSIVLETSPTLALYAMDNIAENSSAMAYRQTLQQEQAEITADIEQSALEGAELDVVWNLTLAANIISANIQYGQIEDIEAVEGVAQVVIETEYEPLAMNGAETYMLPSSGMTGAGTAWSAGYTGAGSRIAIIDTGLDTDHQSFDSGAFCYSLQQLAASKNMTYDAYIETLDLLDAAEIRDVFEKLNIYPYVQYLNGTTNEAYYLNEKVPFALNYVDRDYDVTHDNDSKGQHGSHVAGIAAANCYIPDGSGGYSQAMDSVKTQGVAPDAQLIIMKVFGKSGGAYESDYMVAIEDAVMLGCDAVNLSLGSAKGFARSATYQNILDNLEQSGAIITVAAGNDGVWSEHSASGVDYLYADDVDFANVASPAASTNSLAVASADNTGSTDYYLSVGENIIYYGRGVLDGDYTDGLNALGAGNYAYVFLDGNGSADEVNAAAARFTEDGGDLTKAILVCQRGVLNFGTKAQNAANAGFAACIIYNNEDDGVFSMNLQGYTGTGPCSSISQADGAVLKAAASAVTDADGNTLYYKGSIYVSDEVRVEEGSGSVSMSSFSSWGVPGSLEMKPEITAPGGGIYSVDGGDPSGTAYMNNSGTSMAAPQVAGMTAVLMQYIRENDLTTKTGLTARQLATSLLMGTAEPLVDESTGNYYSVLQQGAGLANVGEAIQADSYIKMSEGTTSGASDGKVKVELGDDPKRSGSYRFSFTIHNFSDKARTYSLSSDFFTQGLFEKDGVKFLDTATTAMAATVSYTVNSQSLTVSSGFACDLNGDGLTDAQDAQLILEYAAGNDVSAYRTAIASRADLNEDGKVTTYDAYLLLSSLGSEEFQVTPGDTTTVTVSVNLTNKAYLNENYINGAYVEGYVYVKAVSDIEGNSDVTNSIPVLGFYGNWSDATMYDRASYEEVVYGDYITPYTGYSNYLTLWPNGGLVERNFIGNPYLVEDSYPAGKEAIKSKTEFGDMAVSLIRGAGGFLFYVLDEDGNFVIAKDAQQLHAAYYSASYSGWYMAQSVGLSIWESPKDWGFKDGDVLTIGFLSVPEYYENYGDALSADDLKTLMKSEKLGDGVHYSYTFTVDDTAPEIKSVTKTSENNLVIQAQDDNYIAAVAVLDGKGGSTLLVTGVEQELAECGSVVETVVDMASIAEKIDKDCMIMVADYAGNESVYQVTGYNDGIDYSGHMYGFTNTATRGTMNSWMEIRPAELYSSNNSTDETVYNGTMDVANMPWNVIAAEYVGGYVYMVTENNELYVAPQGAWENVTLVKRDNSYSGIKDMAYNTKDGKLYALSGDENTVYTVDLLTGELEKQYTVTVKTPEGQKFISDNGHLLAMTIDDEGNFYAVNNGARNDKHTYLYTWTATDMDNGKVNAKPVNDQADGYAGDYVYNNDGQTGMGGSMNPAMQSMAWDHENDVLYWAAAMYKVSSYNILYTFDVKTGKASVATPDNVGTAAGSIVCNVSGLYVVPDGENELGTSEAPNAVVIEPEELTLFVGAQYTLDSRITPWNLADKTLEWKSSNNDVLSVDEDGVVQAKKAGTAEITVTTKAVPQKSDTITVTVKDLEDLSLRGLLYDSDSKVNWVDFNLLKPETSWRVLENGADVKYAFSGGALLENTLYVHDGDHMYGVDANDFTVTDYGELDESWMWSDAAIAPENERGYFNRIVGVISGGMSFGVMDVTTGIGTDFIHYNDFREDPAALIAFKGSTTYDDGFEEEIPAYEYYVLTEAGELYLMTAYAFYDTDAGFVQYDDAIEHIGSTGLRIKGAADVESSRSGSMYYDAEKDYLIVTYNDSSTTHLYVFDPEICAPVEVGTFGKDVWPVTTLHQYESFTTTTVVVSPSKASVYAGDQVQLSAKVYKYNQNNGVTWRSGDETIATVDQTGLVTAKKEGEVTIYATSAETNDAVGSAVITVKPLSGLDVTFHAYLSDDQGGKWVSIDGNDMTVNALSQVTSTAYTGALVRDRKIIATDKKNYYEIDPSKDYQATKGDDFTDGDGASFLYMLDGAAAPVTEQTLYDYGTNDDATVQVGGTPIYISGFDGSKTYYLTLLESYQTGEYTTIAIDQDYQPAAIAYEKSAAVNGYWWDYYYILSYEGLLERFYIQSAVTNGTAVATSGDWYKDTVDTGLRFEDGEALSMTYVKTDEFTGLVISYAGDNGVELYCYDTVKKSVGKLGVIQNATNLVGLSLMSEITGETEEPAGETKTVTFKVVNGTWADGTSTDIVRTVQLDDEGVGTLTVPTGMKPNDGYEGGSWDKIPPAYVEGTKAETYTYTFTAKSTGGEAPTEYGNLLGWVSSDQGMGWSEIDPKTGNITLLAADANYYTGAGVLDGQIYAGCNGYYYKIDPTNSYQASRGVQDVMGGISGYPLVDGSGAPSKTVTLDGKEMTVGGYFIHVFTGSYGSELYLLRDYQTGCTYDDALVDTTYTIYSLKISAIAYLNGSLSADGKSYSETFLLLTTDGTIYQYTLTTTAEGLNTTGVLTQIKTIDELKVTAAYGCASMTRLSDNTVMIAVTNDNTVLYTYTLGSDSVVQTCDLTNSWEFHGLALMSDIAGAESEAQAKTPVTHERTRGSLMSAVLNEDSVDVTWQNVTVKLVETVDVTNGAVEVSFDPAVLRYVDTSSLNAIYAVNNSQAEDGKLTVTYASGEEIHAGQAIASVRFAVVSDGSTELDLTVTERNDQYGLNENSSYRIEVPGSMVVPSKPSKDTSNHEDTCPGASYSDLHQDAWYHEYVDYVLSEGLMNGVSATSFAPDASLSRAMLATILYRMDDSPAVTFGGTFRDVSDGMWYSDAIAWAAQKEIVTGYDENTFGPNDLMTREQLVTMLWRYAKLRGMNVSRRADLSGYADADNISSYAREAMEWAYAVGIIQGVDEDTLLPQGSATRAQVAAMLQRFCTKVLKQ